MNKYLNKEDHNDNFMQGFIADNPKSFISLAVYFFDESDSLIFNQAPDVICSLSISITTPDDAVEDGIGSSFTLHNILAGKSVVDLITKFIFIYSEQGFFANCNLVDDIFVSYVDGSSSNEFTVTNIIRSDAVESAKNNIPEFANVWTNNNYKNKNRTPRLVK